MEPFLQEKYGRDIFFLTYSGAVFQDQEFEYLSAVKQLLFKESIRTIYVVNDTSCRFINSIIAKKKLFGMPSEKALEALYVEYYFAHFKNQPLFHQQYKLAELNIKKQVDEIVSSSLLGDFISEFEIEVKGLITSKAKNTFKEIRIETSRLHEL